MKILVANLGSTSFKYRLFDVSDESAARSIGYELPYLHCDGQIDGPGLERALDLQYRIGSTERRLRVGEVVDLRYQPAPTPAPALRAIA